MSVRAPIDKSPRSSEDRAKEIHSRAIIVNGCAPTRSNLAYAIDAYIRGGVTATNLTTMNNEGFREGGRWLGSCLRTIREAAQSGESVQIIRNLDDITKAKQRGYTGIILGTQNADPIEDDLELLEVFRAVGVRIFQLTYQRRNRLADGCGEVTGAGLSRFGREVVQACNELGILIDVSHVGRQSLFDAVDVSRSPVTITHSNPFSLHGIERNKRDDEIRAVVEGGGIVGVTAVSRYMSKVGRSEGTGLNDYMEQLEYLVELVGIEGVAIGLDINEGMTEDDYEQRKKAFFGKFPELQAGGDFPFENYYARGLSSAADLPSLTQALFERGWRDEEIVKVLGGNFMRLFRGVW